MNEPCGARAYDCRCGLPAAHSPFSAHACDVAGCFASWTGSTENYTFKPVTLPTWPPMPARPARALVLVPPLAS